MKILHVIDHLGQGGAQRGVRDLLMDQEACVEHALFVLRRDNDELLDEHPRLFYSRSNNRYSPTPLLELRRCISEYKPDILHCHLFRSQVFGYLALAGRRSKPQHPRLVYHERGQILLHAPVHEGFLKQAARRVDKFISVSAAAKTVLEQKLNLPETTPSEVVYNGVNVQELQKRAAEPLSEIDQGCDGDFLVCFAGRLEREKGCDIFLRSLEHLAIPYRAVILGEGSERPQLEMLHRRLSLGPRVRFLGARTSALQHIAAANLLVLPSRSEAFPRSALEAMALGTPTLASRVGGIPELILDGVSGMLVPPEQPDALGAAIERIAADDAFAKELAENARLRIKDFSFDSQRETLEAVYGSLLAARS